MKSSKPATANDPVDDHLNEVALKQLTWKPGAMRNIAIAIAQAFLGDRIQWADEVDLSNVAAKDKNCIGSAWRLLAKAGIIEPIGGFRRSIKEASRGRKVFKYRLASERLAKTFLSRNGVTGHTTGQPDLFTTYAVKPEK